MKSALSDYVERENKLVEVEKLKNRLAFSKAGNGIIFNVVSYPPCLPCTAIPCNAGIEIALSLTESVCERFANTAESGFTCRADDTARIGRITEADLLEILEKAETK